MDDSRERPLRDDNWRWLAPEILDPTSFGEQATGKGTKASDVYSFGCVCIEVRPWKPFPSPRPLTPSQIYSGDQPYGRLTDVQALHKLLREETPSCPHGEGESMPDSLWNLVSQTLRTSPGRRPSSPDLLRARIDQMRHTQDPGSHPQAKDQSSVHSSEKVKREGPRWTR